MKVGILILTHNAPEYVKETLETLRVNTQASRIDYEVVVLDNASDNETKQLLKALKDSGGYIDKLQFSEENTLFARGNNMAAEMSSADCDMLLLLNSDVRINDRLWLEKLVGMKSRGGFAAASYGLSTGPNRADGYCFLIDRNIYLQHRLDEGFDWCWGLTKLQGIMLKEGHSILAISDHNRFVYHHGAKSGKDWLAKAKGMDVSTEEIISWFDNARGYVVVKSMSSCWLVERFSFHIKRIIKNLFYMFDAFRNGKQE